jgi:hypothetical protein
VHSQLTRSFAMAIFSMDEYLLLQIAAFTGCAPAMYALTMTHRRLMCGSRQKLLDAALRTSMKAIFAKKRIPHALAEVFTMSMRSGAQDLHHWPQIILTGTALLQVILGEFWNDLDLDIFCTADGNKLVQKRLTERMKSASCAITMPWMPHDASKPACNTVWVSKRFPTLQLYMIGLLKSRQRNSETSW